MRIKIQAKYNFEPGRCRRHNNRQNSYARHNGDLKNWQLCKLRKPERSHSIVLSAQCMHLPCNVLFLLFKKGQSVLEFMLEISLFQGLVYIPRF